MVSSDDNKGQRPMDNMLTKREVCKRLEVSSRTLDRWRAMGLLKSFKRGGIVRFKESEVMAFVNKHHKAKSWFS